MCTDTSVRPLERDDYDFVFAMMAEPRAVEMAAFTAEEPNDRSAFDAHMQRIESSPGVRNWAITGSAGTIVGTISTFPSDENHPEVTYWIAEAHWGHGHASRALAIVLEQTERPVLARAALDNVGSRRVLQNAGFEIVGRNRDYAAGRRAEIDELILRLDE